MWEQLLTKHQHKDPSKTYFQQKAIERERAKRIANGSDFNCRVAQVIDLIRQHDFPDGISAAQLSKLMGYRSEYIVKILITVRETGQVVVEKRKELLNGTYHWRNYYYYKVK